jgi:hypothetical protein
VSSLSDSGDLGSQEELTMSIGYEALKQKVFETAKTSAKKGAGYSQQAVVLDEVASALNGDAYLRLDLSLQQAILTCWHDLFREGALSWGYNLDNPDAPFFHVPERTDAETQPRQ